MASCTKVTSVCKKCTHSGLGGRPEQPEKKKSRGGRNIAGDGCMQEELTSFVEMLGVDL